MRIEGATILVTGASSGIGQALAPMLAERGATVGIAARRADRLEETLALCRAHTPESRLWVVDLSDVEAAVRSSTTPGRPSGRSTASSTTPRWASARS